MGHHNKTHANKQNKKRKLSNYAYLNDHILLRFSVCIIKRKKVTLPTNIVLILLQPNIKNNNYREYQSRLYSQTITNKEGKIGNDYFTFDNQTSSSQFEKVVGFDHQQALLFQNTGPPIRVINANERDNLEVFVNNHSNTVKAT